MRYRLKNLDVGPRYVFTTSGTAPIIQADETSEPMEISDAEIKAARAARSSDDKPLWEVEEVEGEDDDDLDPPETPLSRLNRDELIERAQAMIDGGQTLSFKDRDGNDLVFDSADTKITRDILIAAIKAAPPNDAPTE